MSHTPLHASPRAAPHPHPSWCHWDKQFSACTCILIIGEWSKQISWVNSKLQLSLCCASAITSGLILEFLLVKFRRNGTQGSVNHCHNTRMKLGILPKKPIFRRWSWWSWLTPGLGKRFGGLQNPNSNEKQDFQAPVKKNSWISFPLSLPPLKLHQPPNPKIFYFIGKCGGMVGVAAAVGHKRGHRFLPALSSPLTC